MVEENVWEKPADLPMCAHLFLPAPRAKSLFCQFLDGRKLPVGHVRLVVAPRVRSHGLLATNLQQTDVAAPYAGVRSVLLAGVVRAL